MVITYITYSKGTQKVHLQEEISTRKLWVMHEDKDGASQYPIMYNDGRIAYDEPGRVTKYMRPLVEKALHAKKMIEFARKYDGWHGVSNRDKYTWGIAEDLQAAKLLILSDISRQFMSVNHP